MLTVNFMDNRGEQEMFFATDLDVVPRQGDLVSFCYNDAGDSGMWRVVEVDWGFFLDHTDPYVDVFCEPYNEGEWAGSADAQLEAEAILDDQRRELMEEEP